jgi:flagellum-specific ATP synthase
VSPPLEGHVRTWSLDTVHIDGLEGAALHDRLQFEGGGQGFVTALLRDGVLAVPLDSSPVAIGSSVRVAGPLTVPAGDDLIGLDIDVLGRPLDGGPPLSTSILQPLFIPPAPWGREPIRRRWTTGLLVYDLKSVLPMGATILLKGQVPFLLHHLLRHQAIEGRVCIYARAGSAGSSGRTFREVLETSRLAPLPGPLPPCIFIESGRNPSPAAEWLVPWTAMAIGAALSERGREVVVILDSLDRWRPSVQRFPDEGEWISQVGRLASLSRIRPKGSLTLLAEASPRTARELDSFFDVELDLNRALHGLPVQDGTKRVRPPLKTDPRSLGWAIAKLAQMEDLEQSPPLAAAVAEADLKDARRLQAGLRFRPDLSPDSVEQLISFLALCDLPELPTSSVREFLSAFENRLRLQQGPRLAAIRRDQAYTEQDRAELTLVAREICRSLLR